MSDVVLDSSENYDSSVTKKTSKKLEKGVKITLAILLVFLAIEFVVYFYVVPCLGNVKISWSGITDSEQEKFINIISKESSKNWLKFNTVEVHSLISSIPIVETVRIEKRFPDKVFINVTERIPVAMSFINLDGKTVPVQIDKKGILFSSDEIPVSQNGSIPIVSGIPIENIPEGMKIPVAYIVLIDQIALLKSVNENYFAEVSEIQVVPKQYGNYELVLYPVKGHTRVLADRSLNEKALQYMMVTLDVVKRIEPDVKVVDLRYGSVSYYSNISDIGDSLE